MPEARNMTACSQVSSDGQLMTVEEPMITKAAASAAIAITPTRKTELHFESIATACSTSPASTSAATDASESWTPTRTRSNSSSNFLPLSTFPSSTSPLSMRDCQPHGSAADEESKYPLQDSHRQPQAASQPPFSCLHDQIQSQGWSHMRAHVPDSRTGAACKARERVRGDCQPDKAEGAFVASGDSGDNSLDRNDRDRDHNSSAKTADSQDVAWEQTRLRIAYLVSTMVVPNSDKSTGNVVSTGADTRTEDRTGAGESSLPQSPLPETPTTAAATPAPATSPSDRATMRRDPSPRGCDVDPCPRGWPGVELMKKRRRVIQIQRWCDEIIAFGDSRTYCACSVGCAIPPGDGAGEEHAAPEYTLQDDSDSFDAADAIGCFPSLAPAVLPAPTPAFAASSALSSSSSPSLSPTPSSLAQIPASTSAHTAPLCEGCGHHLTPIRPYIFVGDNGLQKGGRHPQESAAQSLRRAFQGIRGLVSRRKESSEIREEKREMLAQQQRQQREFNRNLARMRPWDQWHELNCQHMSGEFFTWTGMFGGHGSRCTSPMDIPLPAQGRDHSHNHSRGFEHRLPYAANATMASPNSDNIYSSSASDSGNADSQELERRRRREMEARLLRAQRLLATESDERKALASGQTPQLPPLRIQGQSSLCT